MTWLAHVSKKRVRSYPHEPARLISGLITPSCRGGVCCGAYLAFDEVAFGWTEAIAGGSSSEGRAAAAR